MVKAGYLTPAQRAAVRWPAVLAPDGTIVQDANGVNDSAMAQVAGDYLDQVHATDPQVPDSATAQAGGDVIVTTFTRADMTAAVRAVRDQLDDRLTARSAVNRDVQVGLATVDANNGELLGFYPGNSDFDNATQAQIEPGSQMGLFEKFLAFPPAPGSDPLWSLMSQTGLTRNLIADPAELPEPLSKLKTDPDLALGIAPESPARIADAFTIFSDGGVYRDLAMIRSVSVEGRQVWTYTLPAGTKVLPQAFGIAARSSASGTDTTSVGLGSLGIPGTIGGDDSVWYTGISRGVVTSVALWDQAVNAKHQVVQLSLAGLGGVPAGSSSRWPDAIWHADMAAVTPVTVAGRTFAKAAATGA